MKNDLEAAFRNITKISADNSFSPFPTENEAADIVSESKEAAGEAPARENVEENPILLKRKEQKELRNVRKQFIITETLNAKLKEKSRELNLSENEVICQLLTIM